MSLYDASLSDSRRFSDLRPEIIKLGAAYAAKFYYFDLSDIRRIIRKNPFHAYTTGNLAYGETLVGAAGPVVASAVVWDYNSHSAGITDSKLLSKYKRQELFRYIMTKALSVSVGWASPAEIDRINILEASRLAMKRALTAAERKPDVIIIDGNRGLPNVSTKQITVVGGDRKVLCVSAASIVAKVLRDELMYFFDGIFPGYGFYSNVGYPTDEHRKAIESLGVTVIHRKAYKGVREFVDRIR